MQAKAPIDELYVVTPSETALPGIHADDEGDAEQPRAKQKGANETLVIVGTIKLIKENQLQIVADGKAIKVELAKDAEIKVEVDDYTLAVAGDEITGARTHGAAAARARGGPGLRRGSDDYAGRSVGSHEQGAGQKEEDRQGGQAGQAQQLDSHAAQRVDNAADDAGQRGMSRLKVLLRRGQLPNDGFVLRMGGAGLPSACSRGTPQQGVNVLDEPLEQSPRFRIDVGAAATARATGPVFHAGHSTSRACFSPFPAARWAPVGCVPKQYGARPIRPRRWPCTTIGRPPAPAKPLAKIRPYSAANKSCAA